MSCFKKIISCMLISILFISLLPLIASAESTIITREEALNWLYSVEWTTVNTPYGYAGECASLGYRYYEKLLGREIRANKGGTGNGNDYDDDNHSINLGWSRFDITSSTVLEPGDVIVSNYEPYGHVAILISGTATNATLMHQSNSYLNGVTQRTYNENLVGRTCVRPVWKNTEAPTGIWVTTNKTSYKENETVSFTFNSNGANDIRDLYIYLPDGTQEVYWGLGTSFSKSFSLKGKYKALVQAWNNVGPACSETIEFHVGTPTGIWVNTDRISYKENETVTFTFNSDGANDIRDLYIYLPDGTQEVYWGLGTSFSKSFSLRGKYMALVQAWNNAGPACSETIEFHVGAPTGIWVNTDRISYKENETVTFTFNSDGANDIRDLYIYLPDGTQEVYWGLDTSFSKSFNMPGKYEALVQAWNDAGPDCSQKITYYIEEENPTIQSTVTKSGTKLIIDTNVHNIVSPFDIIIAGYRVDRLVTMKRVPHDEQNSPYTLEGDIDEIKVMIWDGLSTIKPLCNAEAIPSSDFITE